MIDLQGTLSSSHSSLPRMFGASWLMSQRASTLGSFISSGNMGSSNCPKFLLYQYYTSIVSWFSDILETSTTPRSLSILYWKNAFGNCSCKFSQDWTCWWIIFRVDDDGGCNSGGSLKQQFNFRHICINFFQLSISLQSFIEVHKLPDNATPWNFGGDNFGGLRSSEHG